MTGPRLPARLREIEDIEAPHQPGNGFFVKGRAADWNPWLAFSVSIPPKHKANVSTIIFMRLSAAFSGLSRREISSRSMKLASTR